MGFPTWVGGYSRVYGAWWWVSRGGGLLVVAGFSWWQASCGGARAQGMQALVVAVLGLSSCGS